MKNLKMLVISFFLCSFTFAQNSLLPDTSWKMGGMGSISFNQVGFTNWAAGGDNSISGSGFLSVFAKYANKKINWDNQLDLAYGLSKTGEVKATKNEDKIDLNSKLGYRAGTGKLFFTFLFNFKSQFDKGFTKTNYSVPVSKFLAPAYVLYSIGMDYKPNENFSLYFSPVTGKTLIISDQIIANSGVYGNEGAVRDTRGNIISSGKKSFTQLGAYFRVFFKKDIFTNVNLQTKLELFSNYLKNPENIAINWEVLFAMKINKYLSANIGTQMIYDDIIAVPINKGSSLGKRTQFKEVFGLGLSYTF